MDRIGIALLAGILGGAAGALAVRFVVPSAGSAAAPAVAEGASLRELKEQVAEIRDLLGRPPPSLQGAPAPSKGPILESWGEGNTKPGADKGAGSISAEQIAAIAEKAAETVLERRAEKEAAGKAPPQKRAPLSEIARELNLSASQETEIREAYREATEKFLKVITEPDGDAEALRKELSESKGNKAKQQGLMMKYMPKIVGKFPEMMAIQAQRDVRVQSALGTEENQTKFAKYKVDESDPFGLEGNVSVGVSNR